MIDQIFGLLLGAATFATPLVLAGLGGLYSERSGVINIALEGKMLAAACAMAVVGASTGNAWVGLVAALAAAVLAGLLHALLTQAFRLDHIISGMGINLVALGGTGMAWRVFSKSAESTSTPAPDAWVFYALAAAAMIATHLYLARTRGGLRLFAVGNDPDKARQAGLRPVAIRYKALMMAGVLCGVAGSLIVGNVGEFSLNMTAGRGYIALAALIIGGWRPIPTAIAAICFGLLQSLQIFFQGTGMEIPPEFWVAMPYAATVLALAFLKGQNRAPSGLGQP